METHVVWKGDMQFDAQIENHYITMDTSERGGGHNRGPGPKSLLLAGLAGCTGMDVISILKKMRVHPDAFSVDVSSEIAEDHPRYFTKIHIVYTLTGSELPQQKIERAVQLSREKYCAVSYMLEQSSEITHEIVLNPV